jgi:hypothetical protein
VADARRAGRTESLLRDEATNDARGP